MTITTFASGTQSAVIGTEHFLSSPNVAGKFMLYLDRSGMLANDVLEVRVYKMPIAGDSPILIWFDTFRGVQSIAPMLASEWLPNALTDTNALRFSIKQTFGTGRNYKWLVQVENDTVGALASQAQTDVQSALTAQGYTTSRAPKLDNLDAAISSVAASVWANGTRTLTSFGTLVADVAAAVWASLSRTLTAGTNIVLNKGIGITGFNDLDGAGVRTAVGLGSANLDTQLSAINTKTTNLPAAPASEGNVSAVGTAVTNIQADVDNIQTRLPAALVGGKMDSTVDLTALTNAILAMMIENGLTFEDCMRAINAALFGLANGGGTSTMHYLSQDGLKNRITASVDADGNRSAVTLDLS